jgi:hypothetical protein
MRRGAGVVLTAVLAVAGLVTTAGAGDRGEERRGTSSQGGRPTWLLVQHADRGTLEVNDDGAARLILEGVDPDTVGFTDRPYRKVDTFPTSEVGATIEAATDKPNAALQVDSPRAATVVLEADNATYDDTAGSAVLEGRVLRRGSVGEVEATRRTPTGALRDVTLFIDGEALDAQAGDSPQSSFEVGATCEEPDQGELAYCWLAEPGGENWPPMDDSIEVTIKNIGNTTLWPFSGYFLWEGCNQGSNPLHPGEELTWTFHHKNEICIGNDNDPGPFVAEIVAIDN